MLEATLLDTYHLIMLNIYIEPDTNTIVHARSEFVNHPQAACPMVTVKQNSLSD